MTVSPHGPLALSFFSTIPRYCQLEDREECKSLGGWVAGRCPTTIAPCHAHASTCGVLAVGFLVVGWVLLELDVFEFEG